MAKNPAVLFYTSDFLSGTAFFTDEQRGQYIRLLCEQHQSGHIPEKHMLFVCQTLSNPVIEKFVKDDNGLYYNVRMDIEKDKRNQYVESRKHIGEKGGRPSLKNLMVNHKDKRMGNHTDNDNDNINKGRVQGKETIDVRQLPEYSDMFKDSLFSNLWEAWLEVRKAKKAPNTTQAFKIALNKLKSYGPEKARVALNNAIERGWKGIFEPNIQTQNNNQQIMVGF